MATLFNVDSTLPMIVATLAAGRVKGPRHLLGEKTRDLIVRGATYRTPRQAYEITELFSRFVPWDSVAFEERDYFTTGLREAPLARLRYERGIRRQVRAYLRRAHPRRSIDRLICSQNTKFGVYLARLASETILIEHGSSEYKTWREEIQSRPRGAKARVQGALSSLGLYPPRIRADRFWPLLPLLGDEPAPERCDPFPIPEQRAAIRDVFAFFAGEFARSHPAQFADLERTRERLLSSGAGGRAWIYLPAFGVPPEQYPDYLGQELEAAQVDPARDAVFIKNHPTRALALQPAFARHGVRSVEFAQADNSFLPVEFIAHFFGKATRVTGSMSVALLYAQLWGENEAILSFVPNGPNNPFYAHEYSGVLRHFARLCPPGLRASFDRTFFPRGQ